MAYRNILVPYDSSESARHALFAALEATEYAPDAVVTVLYVAPVPDIESSSFAVAAQVSGVFPLSAKDHQEMLESYLERKRTEISAELEKLLSDNDKEVRLDVSHGKPSKVICDYVNEYNIDLVVMGCRGLDAVRGMIGSVSTAVLRGVDCPVLVVK